MAKFETEVAALQNSPMFGGVDPSKLRLLAFLGEDRTFRDGEYVIRQGEFGDSAYLILDGVAEVVVGDMNGGTVVANLREQELFGEMAVLCDAPRTASIRAKGELRTLRFDRDSMLRLLREFPEMAVEMSRALAHRLERTTAELVSLRAKMKGGAI